MSYEGVILRLSEEQAIQLLMLLLGEADHQVLRIGSSDLDGSEGALIHLATGKAHGARRSGHLVIDRNDMNYSLIRGEGFFANLKAKLKPMVQTIVKKAAPMAVKLIEQHGEKVLDAGKNLAKKQLGKVQEKYGGKNALLDMALNKVDEGIDKAHAIGKEHHANVGAYADAILNNDNVKEDLEDAIDENVAEALAPEPEVAEEVAVEGEGFADRYVLTKIPDFPRYQDRLVKCAKEGEGLKLHWKPNEVLSFKDGLHALLTPAQSKKLMMAVQKSKDTAGSETRAGKLTLPLSKLQVKANANSSASVSGKGARFRKH